VLKVSDLRSAQIQVRLLAKKALWVSELRIESGLNCGGHAFPTDGQLLATILRDFAGARAALHSEAHELYVKALTERGLPVPSTPWEQRVTVQGGIGTHDEDRLMRDVLGADATGWGTPFLMCPEVAAVTPKTRAALANAAPGDVRLSWGSPLGVPFWSLRTSDSEVDHRRRIDAGKAGSLCTKRYLALHTDQGDVPLCTGSYTYQQRALAQHAAEGGDEAKRLRIVAPTCICHDLSGDVRLLRGVDTEANPSICPGPNIVNFRRDYTLEELVDHIYGRLDALTSTDRPHQLVTEASLSMDWLERELGDNDGKTRTLDRLRKYGETLRQSVAVTAALAPRLPEAERARFLAGLDAVLARLERLTTLELAPAAQ
jgi:hypothetical protein